MEPKSSFFPLPNEVLLHVFGYLNSRDLLNVARVCRQFFAVAHDTSLWRKPPNLPGMPREILTKILKYVPLDSLLNVTAVSRLMKQAAADPELWDKVVIFSAFLPCEEDAFELQQTIREATGVNPLVAIFDYFDMENQLERFGGFKIYPL